MRISDWSSDVGSSDLIPGRQRVAEPPQNASREVRLVSPRVAQPQVSISYLAPSYRQATGNEAYALQVASEIIGGGATARLYSRLVVEQGIAGAAGAGYSPTNYDYSRSEEHTSELQSLMRISYAVFCLKKKNNAK